MGRAGVEEEVAAAAQDVPRSTKIRE